MGKEKEEQITSELIGNLESRLANLMVTKKIIEDGANDEYRSILKEIDVINVQLKALKKVK